MEEHSGNTCSDKDAPPSLASQEHKIQIPEHEFPHKNRQYFDGRRIHRVPHYLRSNKNENEEDYYTPKLVSLGPYHHGSPQLSKAESFKPLALETLLSGSDQLTREILETVILNVIDQVRNCYVGISEGEHYKIDDKILTDIMVLDSCFVIYVMKMMYSEGEQGKELRERFLHHLGMSALSYIDQDMYLLENQIPLWLIKHLLSLIYNEEEGSALLSDFLSGVYFGDRTLKSTMPYQPLHLLDACRMRLVHNEVKKPNEGQNKFGMINCPFHSVTDLKAKGIYLRPSSSCLKDVKFQSYGVFAILRVPWFLFTDNSKLHFSNMIAYELSSFVGFDIICYLNFLKSLVVKPRDVRELQEKKILFSSLESDEQVLQVIKEIDTSGLHFPSMFDAVKVRIAEHCNSKAKAWIAEFFNTYFHSPWTFIALIAVIFQLCLTIVQTYYAIHPAS